LQNLASPSPSWKFQRVFKSLPNLGRKFQYRRYTIGNRSHTLWFSLFLVVARRSSLAKGRATLVVGKRERHPVVIGRNQLVRLLGQDRECRPLVALVFRL